MTSDSWARALVPLALTPVASAVVTSYLSAFGSAARLRKQLQADTELLSRSGLDYEAATVLRKTVAPRIYELVAATEYPRLSRGEIPALVLTVLPFAALPIAFAAAKEGRFAALAATIVLVALAVPISGAWSLIGRDVPQRARERLVYLSAGGWASAEEKEEKVKEDAELVALWTWCLGALFVTSWGCWLGGCAYGAYASLPLHEPAVAVHDLLGFVGVSVAVLVLIDTVTHLLQNFVDAQLWSGLTGVTRPGVAERWKGLRGTKAHVTWRPLNASRWMMRRLRTNPRRKPTDPGSQESTASPPPGPRGKSDRSAP